MAVRFHARGSDGKVAIYTGSDDAPMDDPLGNMSRVLFHSDLLYPKIVMEVSGTLSLPARGANETNRTQHLLFGHGLPGTPMVIGYAILDGIRVGLCGSVPVQMAPRGWARWLSLGATGTHVVMGEMWFSDNGQGFGGIAIPWTVYVTDTMF